MVVVPAGSVSGLPALDSVYCNIDNCSAKPYSSQVPVAPSPYVGIAPARVPGPMDILDFGWDDDAWDAWRATEHSDPLLYMRLSARLRQLADDSGRADLRSRRMDRPPVWRIDVYSGDNEWTILWDLADDGVPQIWYIGPNRL